MEMTVMEFIWVVGFAALVFTGSLLFVVIDKTVSINREAKLREALMWATAYIQCNMPSAAERYGDYKNAVALVSPDKDLIGPFQMLVAENEDLREQLAKVS